MEEVGEPHRGEVGGGGAQDGVSEMFEGTGRWVILPESGRFGLDADGDPAGGDDEIGDPWADGGLAADRKAVEAMVAKGGPERAFAGREVGTLGAGVEALGVVAISWHVGDPLPNPPPS